MRKERHIFQRMGRSPVFVGGVQPFSSLSLQVWWPSRHSSQILKVPVCEPMSKEKARKEESGAPPNFFGSSVQQKGDAKRLGEILLSLVLCDSGAYVPSRQACTSLESTAESSLLLLSLSITYASPHYCREDS